MADTATVREVPGNVDPTPASVSRLTQVLSRPDTVLFVGSGVSAWAGLPTWRGLLAELSAFLTRIGEDPALVDRELRNGDLLQAASYGFDRLTVNQRCEFLRATCRVGSAGPSELHRTLATLGPTCFITTNYDQLLEDAIRQCRHDALFRVVSTTNLIEAAEIARTRAAHFIFKPHGDIGTCDSIVLTREDYRTLSGPKGFILETLKILLVSRPTVFVGYSLRDPDFLLIKDMLATVYHGAAQDSYAIVPDVDPLEVPYWRNNYGVHLLSYSTDPGSRTPHASLLGLLEEAQGNPAAMVDHRTERGRTDTSDNALSILRHAKRVQGQVPTAPERIPLTAAPKEWSFPEARFFRQEVTQALSQYEGKVLLTGPPGAGKSFVMRQAASDLAATAIETLLRGDEEASPRIPTFVDLRDYAGDLWAMVEDSFTVGVPVEELVGRGVVVFFVDGVNEVPSRYLEDGSLHADLAGFLKRVGDCTVVFGARFAHLVADLELPEVVLDQIESSYLEARLPEFGIDARDVSPEILQLLARPLFYRLLHGTRLPADLRTPHDIYSDVMRRVATSSHGAASADVDFFAVFAPLAFDAIDAGGHLIPLASLRRQLRSASDNVDVTAVINELIAAEFVIPSSASEVALFHHSVTEYLASHHLARRYELDRAVLSHCLTSRSWDYAVLLTLAFLPASLRDPFLDEVMRTDPAVAVRALDFLEQPEEWATEVLTRLRSLTVVDHEALSELSTVLSRVTLHAGQVADLWELGRRDDMLGGVAVSRAVDLEGSGSVRRAIDRILDPDTDFNFCTRLGEGIASRVDLQDVAYAFDRLTAMHPEWSNVDDRDSSDDATTALLSGIAEALAGTDTKELLAAIGPPHRLPAVIRATLLEHLVHNIPEGGLEIAFDLLERDPRRAVIASQFVLIFGRSSEDIDRFDPGQYGPRIMSTFELGEGEWAIGALHGAAESADRWRAWVREQASVQETGIAKAALHYASGDHEAFFSALESVVDDPQCLGAEPIGLLGHCRVSWGGHEKLLVRLLRLRNPELAVALLDNIVMFMPGREAPTKYDLGDWSWWVTWLEEVAGLEEPEEATLLFDRLGKFIAQSIDADCIQPFIEFVRTRRMEERRAVAHHVLPAIPGLRLEHLDPVDVEWALAELRERQPRFTYSTLLGSVATEDFVEGTVLPMLADATQEKVFRFNLLRVTREAERRHGRRYVSATGEPLS